jgi:hypothetical protein
MTIWLRNPTLYIRDVRQNALSALGDKKVVDDIVTAAGHACIPESVRSWRSGLIGSKNP